ncbi:hypothetical protein BGZ63DRAFT_436511, partial [Mariannaea sp. PMI_226]
MRLFTLPPFFLILQSESGTLSASHWPESWHENAIAGVRTIWEEEYKTQPETGPAEPVDEVSTLQKRHPNEWDALLEELEVTEDLGNGMDDLEDFIKATPIKI